MKFHFSLTLRQSASAADSGARIPRGGGGTGSGGGPMDCEGCSCVFGEEVEAAASFAAADILRWMGRGFGGPVGLRAGGMAIC